MLHIFFIIAPLLCTHEPASQNNKSMNHIRKDCCYLSIYHCIVPKHLICLSNISDKTHLYCSNITRHPSHKRVNHIIQTFHASRRIFRKWIPRISGDIICIHFLSLTRTLTVDRDTKNNNHERLKHSCAFLQVHRNCNLLLISRSNGFISGVNEPDVQLLLSLLFFIIYDISPDK